MLPRQKAPDPLDALDKDLEYVQAPCEKAAHMVLRHGDCNDDIVKLNARLGEMAELVGK